MIVVEGGQVVVTGSRMDVVCDMAALLLWMDKNRNSALAEALTIAKEMRGNGSKSNE